MRTTGNMLINNMINYISTNQSRMQKYQYMMSTGKKIQTPSDDPVVAARALKLRTDVSEIEQYKRNIEDGQSWMNITEDAISNVGDILKRANELAVQASSETNTLEDRQKIKSEIEQLKEQIIKTANTNYNGRYIFSGFQTNQPLINEADDSTAVPPKVKGTYAISVDNTQKIKYEVGVGDKIDINVIGGDLFSASGTAASSGATPTMIANLDDFILGLDTNDTAKISAAIENTSKDLGNVLLVRAEVGAKTNRLELTMNRLEDAGINFTDLMSKNEDVDQAEVILQLTNEENVYKASLAAGARIIQPSLVDFLR